MPPTPRTLLRGAQLVQLRQLCLLLPRLGARRRQLPLEARARCGQRGDLLLQRQLVGAELWAAAVGGVAAATAFAC